MKAISLAIIFSILLTPILVICLRHAPSKKPAKKLTLIFFLSIPLTILANIQTPDNFWIYNEKYLISNSLYNFLFQHLLYGAFYFGGLLQLYNLADRGFSLRILIDIKEAPGQRLAVDEIEVLYSEGAGIKWMYKKRLDDMVGAGLIFHDHNLVRATTFGKYIGMAFKSLRELINLQNSSTS